MVAVQTQSSADVRKAVRKGSRCRVLQSQNSSVSYKTVQVFGETPRYKYGVKHMHVVS